MTDKNNSEHNPQDFIDNCSEIAKSYAELMSKYSEKEDHQDSISTYENYAKIWSDIASKTLENPDNLYKEQIELANNYAKIWSNAWERYTNSEENIAPLYSPNARDKRFKNELWDKDITFDVIKQSYILTTKWLHDTVRNIDDIDSKTAQKFEFYTQQLIDAISPSNFAFTNPDVIEETVKTGGQNLIDGMKNMLNDMEKTQNSFQINTADKDSFTLGKDIAVTKGEVVYKNDLIELIQYHPKTPKAHRTPLLIIPAWINKYYILDLSEKNSMVKWLLEQGHSVFMISWINPTAKHADKKFSDYMLEGSIAATEEIRNITGEKQINAMGYCLGGTLLSATMAYLKHEKKDYIKSATLLTTMVDFGDAGNMSVFIDEEQLSKMDEKMRKNGFLDGSEISSIFSMLRANDLIWSFVVNNYLLGKNPMPFDILYWNADATRLPCDTHSFYLRNMYLRNLLCKKNGIEMAGVKIDVTTIDTPTYILSAREDHIAPWNTTYQTTQLFKGDCRFVLTASGHVAGVINHPAKNKYCYWLNDQQPKSYEKWLEKAQSHDGSWWLDWGKWLSAKSGKMIKSRTVKNSICPAPGEYVKEC